MRRLLLLFPLCLGLFIGFAVPMQSVTYYQYLVRMLPASGDGYQSPVLTCGWHAGGCGTKLGDFLDWDNTDRTTVYFRGIFTRATGPYETNRLSGNKRVIQGGANDCEISDVSIMTASGTTAGVMRYIHMDLNSAGTFAIPTYGGGQYYARSIGSMTANDYGIRCPWGGTHVHAGYRTDIGAAARTKNATLYPSGDYCPSTGPCRTYKTDNTSNWTHQFQWYGP